MKAIVGLIALCASLFLSPQPKKVRVHTLGDSTMEQQNPNVKDQRGWPQLLKTFFTDDVEVINPAKSGTSTKTYYCGGYWDRAKKAILPGDYVFIQFGHNDEKHGGVDGKIGTAANDSFRIYLTRYVTEVRSMGGIPILFTPVVRKMFGSDGHLSRRGKHDLGEDAHNKIDKSLDANDTISFNYPYNMKLVAKQLNCSLIDMTELTSHFVDSIGQSRAGELIYNLTDGTHFGTSGALLFSSLAAKELRRQKILEQYIKPDPKLIVPFTNLSFGTVFSGTTPTQVFDVCYLGNKSSSSKIRLTATEGFLLSTKMDGDYQQTLELPTSFRNGVVVYKLFVKAITTKLGTISGVVNITDKNETYKIVLGGESLEVKDNQKAIVTYSLNGNEKGETEGNVSALKEVWSGMDFSGYQIPEELHIIGGSLSQNKVQINNIQGGVWPKGELDVVYSRYVQFGIKVGKGSDLYIDSIGFYSGGGVNYRVVASQTEDFNNAITLGESKGVSGSTMMANSFKPNQQVASGKTYFLRIYPWGKDGAKEQSLIIGELTYRGINIQK